MRRTLFALGLTVFVGGCGGDDDPGGGVVGTGGASADSGTGGDAAVLPDTSLPDTSLPDTSPDMTLPDTTLPDTTLPDTPIDVPPVCTPGEKLCAEHATRRFCNPAGQWEDETCASGSGCVRGDCVPSQCSDECTLGATDGARTCEPFDIATGNWVAADPAASLHDRARAYLEWLHRDGMVYGGVVNAHYADPPNYTQVDHAGGIGDSAIWTGTYLASEALRLKATGSADAREKVKELVNTLHLWFNVAGEPGLLSRYAAPSGTHPIPIPGLDCSAAKVHCNVDYNGTMYDYSGHISRDQYQGVMLGYALAYEALGEHDEATRALIRDDVVEFVQQLMLERSVNMTLTFNGALPVTVPITMRFAVLSPREMNNGAIDLRLDTNNLDDSEMLGFQEFIPNLALLVRQVPFLGFTPDIPRSSSAIMLSSFFQVANLVTEGVEGYDVINGDIMAYYEANPEPWGSVTNWLSVATSWSYLSPCGDSYYGNNIAMEPMYNLARLEQEPVRRGFIQHNVLNQRMWPTFVNTKNPFFSFIYASNFPTADPSVTASAVAQLGQFPPPPRIDVPVDLRNDPKYPNHQSGCTDQVDHSTAVDVGDRVVSDFIWQRQPWGLFSGGNLNQTYPGVDYLVAYWMGRYHNYIFDDTQTHCLAWH